MSGSDDKRKEAERSRVRLEAGEADDQLSNDQLAELRERAKNPGSIASPERVAAVLATFRGG